MTERRIDSEIRLIPYYRNDGASLPWYQDLGVCRQVDDRDTPYDLALLHRMYDYLCAHGDCYYIEYRGALVGDVSLRDSGEIAIVVCKEYQNRHIGRRCVLEMLRLAEEKGIRDRVKIFVGGAPISQSFCDEIGADVYTEDAAAAARAAAAALRTEKH